MRLYLWLLPFSKDSSSSSLFSRSLLFMKGNFLLKLIFCFALGPRLRVPVDLHKVGLMIRDYFHQWTWEPTNLGFKCMSVEKALNCLFKWNPLSFLPKVAFQSCECTQELDIASGPHGDTLRGVHVTWKETTKRTWRQDMPKEFRQSDIAKRTHPKVMTMPFFWRYKHTANSTI